MNWFKRIINHIISYWRGDKYNVAVETDVKPKVLLPIENSPGRYVFYCPGCQDTHVINTDPKRQWPCHTLTGTLDNPTIRASVLSIGDKRSNKPHCHSFITNGKIEFLLDCTHHLAGQTVPLEPF